MPRASCVIPSPTAGPPFREGDLRTTCVECHAVQSLDEATIDERDPLATVYRCTNGCATPILLLTPPGAIPGTSSGYRLKDWMMRNPSDLLVQRPECTAVSLIFPASPHALERVALSTAAT